MRAPTPALVSPSLSSEYENFWKILLIRRCGYNNTWWCLTLRETNIHAFCCTPIHSLPIVSKNALGSPQMHRHISLPCISSERSQQAKQANRQAVFFSLCLLLSWLHKCIYYAYVFPFTFPFLIWMFCRPPFCWCLQVFCCPFGSIHQWLHSGKLPTGRLWSGETT